MPGLLSRLRPQRPRRPRRRTVLVVLIACAVALVPLELFYVHPRTDRPRPADVIFVLGGTVESARKALGVRLYDQGLATNIVMSWPRSDGSCDRAAHIPTDRLTCLRPTPFTTQGEARLITQLAEEHGWRSIIVVTSDDQVTRARIRMRRCWHGPMQVVAVPQPAWQIPYKVAYEVAATVKAEVLQRSC